MRMLCECPRPRRSLGSCGLNQTRSRVRIPASRAKRLWLARRRVASLPRQTTGLGGGRSHARFPKTAPEGTAPARGRRSSPKG